MTAETKRVLADGERKVWETQRARAFTSLVRKLAADYVEHVAKSDEHVIKDFKDSGEPNLLIDSTINMLKHYDKDPYAEILAGYHQITSAWVDKLRLHNHDRATTEIVAALVLATRPDREIERGGLLGAIGYICSDALDSAFFRNGGSPFGFLPRVEEQKWQATHGKDDWDAYAERWAGEYEDHIEGHAQVQATATAEPATIDGERSDD
jgi:hypothetical protein